jgi:Ni,Fe-hydrogenase I small subunit
MITRETKIEDTLREKPELVKIFIDAGAPCLVCGEPFWGTVEELCKRYNVNIDSLLKRLNEQGV